MYFMTLNFQEFLTNEEIFHNSLFRLQSQKYSKIVPTIEQ